MSGEGQYALIILDPIYASTEPLIEMSGELAGVLAMAAGDFVASTEPLIEMSGEKSFTVSSARRSIERFNGAAHRNERRDEPGRASCEA